VTDSLWLNRNLYIKAKAVVDRAPDCVNTEQKGVDAIPVVLMHQLADALANYESDNRQGRVRIID
jgi:hypothetical protein